jgi:prephenate dehydrogenase
MAADMHTVAVVGLGLIGGSIARDLAHAGARILGYDQDAGALDAARDAGVVRARLGHDMAGLETADILVVAVPVSATEAVLRAAAPHLQRGALVMDVGSTKRGALAAAKAAGIAEQFVGAHPMTGDHRTGWSASRVGLFKNAMVFLSAAPTARAELLSRAQEFWSSLGARTRVVEADEHDAMVAYTSHLPHVASAALALAMPHNVSRDAIGPGGRDALRLAGGSADLWTAIVMDNADAIGRSLGDYRDRLDAFRDAVQRGDREALLAMLAEARAAAATLRADQENVRAV